MRHLPKVFYLAIVVLLSISLLDLGCSGAEECSGEIGLLTINPNSSTCKKQCDCNNQNYEGACIRGECISFKRKPCEQVNDVQTCKTRFAGQGCKEGLQICRDEGLKANMWGDCKCKGSPKEISSETLKEIVVTPEENPVVHDSPDAATPEEKVTPEPVAEKASESTVEVTPEPVKETRPPENECTNGDKRPCSSTEKGACKPGEQVCQNGKWSNVCNSIGKSSKEVCNEIDDDCNGIVDDLPNCVSTFAGKCGSSGRVDGAFGVGLLNRPTGLLKLPAGDYLVADEANHCIRGIASDGRLYKYAGDCGTKGLADGDAKGTGPLAQFTEPTELFYHVPTKAVYVADTGNHCIRKIDISTGKVIRFAGICGKNGTQDGLPLSSQFNKPRTIAANAKGMFVADSGNYCVRSIQNGIVETAIGECGKPGVDDGSPTKAQFQEIRSMLPLPLVPPAPQGDSLFLEWYISPTKPVAKVRRFSQKANDIRKVTGTEILNKPWSMVLDASKKMVYVSDFELHQIFVYSVTKQKLTLFAGAPGSGGHQNGPLTGATFKGPSGMLLDGKRLLISDYQNHCIRQIYLP